MRKKLVYAAFLVFYSMEYLLLKIIPFRKEKSILIVRLDAIGDFIIWLDAAKQIKKYFPDKHLVLLCNLICKDIAERIPYFDEIIAVDSNKIFKHLLYRLKSLIALKKRHFEQIINPVFSRDFFVHDTLIHHLCSDKKIGYKGDYQNTKIKLLGFGITEEKYTKYLEVKANKWYSALIESLPQPLMELNKNAAFIRHYFDPSFRSQMPVVPFQIPATHQKPEQKYIVFFLGASMIRKVWPIANYAELIENVDPGYEIVLCGGKEDKPHYEEFKKINVANRIIKNLVGKTTLIELISIIKQAVYIITNDTSASHIAVAVRTPSVCILSGAHYGRFQPYVVEMLKEVEKKYLPKIANCFMDCYDCNHVCKYIPDKNTTYPCVAKISPQQVIKKIMEIENESID